MPAAGGRGGLGGWRKLSSDDRLVIVTASYSEPAVLWRLRHPDGRRARATFIPGAPQSTLVFFLDDKFDRGENVSEWEPALARADEVRRALEEDGWTPDV